MGDHDRTSWIVAPLLACGDRRHTTCGFAQHHTTGGPSMCACFQSAQVRTAWSSSSAEVHPLCSLPCAPCPGYAVHTDHRDSAGGVVGPGAEHSLGITALRKLHEGYSFTSGGHTGFQSLRHPCGANQRKKAHYNSVDPSRQPQCQCSSCSQCQCQSRSRSL